MRAATSGSPRRAGSSTPSTGGRINTDFIDNSAGVDTSDHEVNIKILLDRVVRDGDLTEKQRNKVLAGMTDEVAHLVLRDNYEQNLSLANAAANAPGLLHVHEFWMKKLESDGILNRELEGLPSSREVRQRLERKEGLTVPELSVLMAWTKIVLADELLESDLPDDPYLDLDLKAYFPTEIREGFEEQITEHPLRRQIIVTQVVNDLVNGAGLTFWPRLAGETGATPAELTRANFVAREIFGSLPLRQELEKYDNKLDAGVQTQMRLEMRTLVERASRWLINNRRPPLDSQGTVDAFAGPVQAAMGALPDLMTGRELAAYERRRDALMKRDVPEDLAGLVATFPPAYMLLNVIEIAQRDSLDAEDVARVHFALGERLGLPVAGAADPRPAARRPVADDGPCRAARRPALGARAAHVAGAAHDRRRPALPRPDRGVGGGGRGHRRAGHRDAGRDLRRRERRPGPDVRGPPRGARAACEPASPQRAGRAASTRSGKSVIRPSTPAAASAATWAARSPWASGSSPLRRSVGRNRFSARSVNTDTSRPASWASSTRVVGAAVAPSRSSGNTSVVCTPTCAAYEEIVRSSAGATRSPKVRGSSSVNRSAGRFSGSSRSCMSGSRCARPAG